MQNTNESKTQSTNKSSGKIVADTTAKTAGVIIGIYAGLFVVATVNDLAHKFISKKTDSEPTEES